MEQMVGARGAYLLARQEIGEAIAEDDRCRYPGVTEGLYRIKDLTRFEKYTYCPPTLRQTDAPLGGFDRAGSDGEFVKRFRQTAPILNSFSLKAHGLVLAGGAASALLMYDSPEKYIHDYDLFLVGLSEDEAIDSISKLAKHLYQVGPLEVFRTVGCVSFVMSLPGRRPLIVQVILRLYATLAEVIHGFDLGSSAVAFDGECVHLTRMGKLAAERGANVLNLQARRPSYETRITKYVERGYDLIVPNLDLFALQNNVLLPYMEVYHQRVCKNNILYVGCLVPAFPDRPRIEEIQSDYYSANLYEEGVESTMKRNLSAISDHRIREKVLCARSQYHPELDFRTIEPKFDVDLLVELGRRAFSGTIVSHQKLQKLYGEDLAEMLIKSFANNKFTVSDVVLRVVSDLRIQSIAQKGVKIPFEFMSVLDKTALTGPYTREVVSAKEWYGDCYAGF